MILILVFLSSGIESVANENVCKDSYRDGYLIGKCNKLCSTAECDIYDNFSTTKNCKKSFDNFFEETNGKLPVCFPRRPLSQGVKLPHNELWCYANLKADLLEYCDPLFDPAIDNYGNVDETDGLSEYEVCFKNKQALFDICVYVYYVECSAYECEQIYSKHCYDEYEVLKNQTLLNECLVSVEKEVKICEEKKCTSYLIPNISNW